MNAPRSRAAASRPPAYAEADALLARLRELNGTLSPKLACAAGYLVAHPDEIAFTSMRRMAERAGVQPAIMVRLAQHLGYDGYAALRAPFRAALERQPAGFAQRARDLQGRVQGRGGGKPLSRLAGELIALERENLAATLDALGGERVAEASRRMAGARRLYIAGQRSLFSVATYVYQVGSMFRGDIVLLDGAGDAWADALRRIGPDDTLLAISFDPYARGTVAAARFAHHSGAEIVAITDSSGSPLADVAQTLLPVAAGGPGLVPSVVSATAIAQILTNQMLAQGGQPALEMLSATEAQLDAFDTYWRADHEHERIHSK